MQVVVLGTGDQDLEEDLSSLQDRFPGQLAVRIDFDEGLAQRIYAGADYFMMPSAFEPSGLAQMMAMRYGTLPIVHETGGLRDSVLAYNAETGAGDGLVSGITTLACSQTFCAWRRVFMRISQKSMLSCNNMRW